MVAADGGRSLIRRALGIRARPFPYDHAYLGLEAERPAGYRNAMHLNLHAEGGVLLMPRRERSGVGVLVARGSSQRWCSSSDAELSRTLVQRAPILAGKRLFRQGSHVYSLTRAHAERYQAQGAVLLGDAAHATNPTAGQGMSQALFACSDQRPDVVLLAKALGGGLVPLAACIARRSLIPEDFALAQASTFANNNLTCAAGLALLDALEAPALLESVRETGAQFGAGLRDLARRYPGAIRDVRGRGMMWGVELREAAADTSFLVTDITRKGGLVALCASYLLNVHGLRVIPSLRKAPVLRLLPALDTST